MVFVLCSQMPGDRQVNDPALSAAIFLTEVVITSLGDMSEKEQDDLPAGVLPGVFDALHKTLSTCFEFLQLRPTAKAPSRILSAVVRLTCVWTGLEPRKFADEFLSCAGFVGDVMYTEGNYPRVGSSFTQTYILCREAVIFLILAECLIHQIIELLQAQQDIIYLVVL